MTTRQIVNELERKGYSVQFYIRKDGGLLIKSINGIKFSGASGNLYARQILGIEMSQRRSVQLTRITKERRHRRGEDVSVDEELKRQFRRIQRKWRKNVDISKTGQPTMKKVRWRLKHEGIESARSLLNEWEKYSKGIAYTEVVKALYDSIITYNEKIGNASLNQLANDIWENRDSIRDEWILPAYESLYKLNAGIDPEVVASSVRVILRLG